ncbi:aldo/keto reductase [Poritiphilus flavus]|uniref:Aldo/keto reductase n=1 Tax=Poritiphilus flavus TaxID=2697053 RepID=A0A6L9EEZ8_9FLAO|nr:aldo/keto reductase [Poritiphilus flavus]NAS13306.1 aldo/keto reductase [Poritiphilus flavus]
MKRINLGNIGLEVSQLCLGTMYFGTKTDQSQSEKLLDYFTDQGGNFIDTSNNYAFWMEDACGDESETVLGKWLKRRGKREHVVLATKCGARPVDYTGDLGSIKLEGLSYKTIINAVEQSLKRLQTDYLDVIYGHVDFMEYPIDERLKAFTLLEEQGKIRFAGSSNTMAWRLAESQLYSKEHAYVNYSFAQQRYTFLRPRYTADFWVQILLEEEMLNYGKHHPELTIVAYATLLSGFYGKKDAAIPEEYDTEDSRLRLLALSELAKRKSCTMNQLVLAWIMAHTPRIIPIISGSKVSQLEESLGAVNIELSGEEHFFLSNSGL